MRRMAKKKTVVIALELDTEADAGDVAASVGGYFERGGAVMDIQRIASQETSVPVIVKSFRVGVGKKKGKKK